MFVGLYYFNTLLFVSRAPKYREPYGSIDTVMAAMDGAMLPGGAWETSASMIMDPGFRAPWDFETARVVVPPSLALTFINTFEMDRVIFLTCPD
jgi:hypothetical protein